jgi:type IV secretory pathway TrbD component
MLISDLVYPTSRLYFYSALKQDDKTSLFNMSAALTAIYIATLNLALWLFAIKMWALSQTVVSIQTNQDPLKKDTLLKAIYYTGIVLNALAGVFMGIS